MREEFASMEWAGRNKMSKSPNIVQATNFFNQIALWVAQEVLNAYEIKQRCQTISFFISVLKASLDLNNLNGVRSILAGMQSTPVYRLARTWEALSKRDRLLYDRISALMSTDNNSEAYRKKINQAKIPCIPYLGIYLGDLTYIYEAWRSVKGDEARVLQCIEREAQMEAVLDEIAKMQSTCYYNLEMNDAIQTGVRAQFYPSESIGAWEKDQYQTSYILEPKRAPGSAILPEARHRSATDGPTTLSEGSKFYLLRPNINLRMPKLPSSSVREESQGSAPSVPPNARGNAALPFRVNTKLGRGGRNVNSLDDAKVVKTEVGVVLSMSHTEKRGKLDLSNTEEVRKDHVEASSYLCKDKSDKYYSGELPPRVEIRPSSDIDLVPLSTSMKSEGEATLIPMRDTGSLDVMPLNSARSSRGPTFGTSRRKERKMQKRRDGTGEELNSDCDLSMNLDGTSRLSTNNVHQSIRSSQASSFGTELDMCQNLSPPSSTILENVKELTLSPPEDILQASKGLRISVEISDFDSIPKSLSPTPFQDCESQPLPKVLTRAGSESQIPSIRSSTATKLMQSHVYIKHETNEDGSRSNRRPWVKCCATLYPTYLCVDSSRTKLRESLFFW
ncbi:ras guanine nucleotide exchange factor domain-containing protein [Chytridium lagenaria]|nr:ras guanine nucleotide exchange factor domain-containing protein [Chytridium lagenaria]